MPTLEDPTDGVKTPPRSEQSTESGATRRAPVQGEGTYSGRTLWDIPRGTVTCPYVGAGGYAELSDEEQEQIAGWLGDARRAKPCWRSECRNGCYYPDVCSGRAR